MAKTRLFKAFIPTKGKFVEVEARNLLQAREMCPAGRKWEEVENFGNYKNMRAYRCHKCKYITRSPSNKLMINCRGCGRSLEANVTNEVFD